MPRALWGLLFLMSEVTLHMRLFMFATPYAVLVRSQVYVFVQNLVANSPGFVTIQRVPWEPRVP